MTENRTPKVSIVMPVFNAEAFLKPAIESILNQTFKDFELLIVNDGSTDSSRDLIAQFNDFRIKIVDHEENRGLVSALNHGFSLSSGEYIARMDSDDISRLDRLEKQLRFLDDHPNVGMVGTWFKYINKDVVIESPVTPAEIRYFSLYNSPFGHPTVMLRKVSLIAVSGPYNDEFSKAEDYELWCRLIDTLETANIPEVLLDYRIHAQQISAQGLAQKTVADRIRLGQMRKMVGVSLPYDDRRFLELMDRSRVRSVSKIWYKLWLLSVVARSLFCNFLPPRFVVKFWKENRN